MDVIDFFNRNTVFKKIIVACGSYAFLAMLVHYAIDAQRHKRFIRLETEISQKLSMVAAKLDAELYANIALAQGLSAYVSAVRTLETNEIQEALARFQKTGRHILAVSLAPNNRPAFTYPLHIKENTAISDLDYPDQFQKWPLVQKARQTQQTLFIGPVTFQNSQSVFISRTPIFFRENDYWGMLTLVLDAQSLYADAGFLKDVDSINFALRTAEPDQQTPVFFGDPAIFAQNPKTLSLETAGNLWMIAASPKSGWDVQHKDLLFLEILCLCLTILPVLALYGYQLNREKVTASEKRLRAFLDTTRDAVIVINFEGNILEFNPAAVQLFGYEAHEILGHSVSHLMPNDVARKHHRYIDASTVHDERTVITGREVEGCRKDGSLFPVEITIGTTVMNGGERVHVGVVRDITERKAFENQLLELANTDALTGVANRRSFMEHLQRQFILAQRHGHPLSVLMLDADHFKRVNDIYGHHTGDVVLCMLTEKLQACLRASDILGRLGGEEFAVLLPQTDILQARMAAERLLKAIRESFLELENGTLRITISIGIASNQDCAPSDEDPEILLQQADEALYRAKAEGRDRYCG